MFKKLNSKEFKFPKSKSIIEANKNKFSILNISKIYTLNSLKPTLYSITKYQFSKRGSREWMNRHVNDKYVKKTRILEYRSRAAFKLIEIHEKYKLLRPGQKVLDVGSAPGGWSQVIAEYTKSTDRNPLAVAVDILDMEDVPGVHFIRGDMTKQDVQDEILNKNNYEKFDLVLSDMCPEFTGTKAADHVNLIQLNETTIDFASKVLKRNGNFVMKTFEGTLQRKLQERIKKYFNKIHRFKPASSRSDSSELFLVCIGYLENEELKKEAEEITKLSPEEFFEKEKTAALKQYKLAKLNELTLLEDLDKMKEEIKAKFKIDPDKIKIDEKEEEELKKTIAEENEILRDELYGRAYKLYKGQSFSKFVEEYQAEMESLDVKLREILKKDKVEMEEYEEFFKQDVDKKHLDEITKNAIQEVDYYQKQIDALSKQITEEEAQELLRMDGKENEILAKYKKWEKIIEDVGDSLKKNQPQNEDVSADRISDGMISSLKIILFFQ